ncbi:uncharacterized protein [Callorhinus ursinus]|uniref:uncharacterized protein n=1 Tax=Callorhinus ursinus TaxID=34884 RepID=UPI003CD042B2
MLASHLAYRVPSSLTRWPFHSVDVPLMDFLSGTPCSRPCAAISNNSVNHSLGRGPLSLFPQGLPGTRMLTALVRRSWKLELNDQLRPGWADSQTGSLGKRSTCRLHSGRTVGSHWGLMGLLLMIDDIGHLCTHARVSHTHSTTQPEHLGDRPPKQPCRRCRDLSGCSAADPRGPPGAPGTTRPTGTTRAHGTHQEPPGLPGTTQAHGAHQAHRQPPDHPEPPGPLGPPGPTGPIGPTGNHPTTRPAGTIWTTWTTGPTGLPGTSRPTGTHSPWTRGDPKPLAGMRCATRIC